MVSQRLLLFGDQTVEKLPSIQNLVRLSKASPLLRRFLREAIDIVQREVSYLSLDKRKAFIAFDDIVTLAEENAKEEDPDEVVATTLITIARLGELLIYAENDPSILDTTKGPVHMLGLCTGLLPAAAAAVARNTSELLNFALEIIAISVRLAEGITARSKQIEPASGSWGYTIVGATAKESHVILDKFHKTQQVPSHRHVCLGVTSQTWTTVFGPPSILAKLWTFSPELGLAPKLKLAAGAAVHASHLPMLDMDKIIGNSPLLSTRYPTEARIISSSTSLPYVATDLRTLLYGMIPDITQNTLRLTSTVEALVSDISGNGGDVDLMVVGPTAHTRLVQGALQEADIKVNLILRAEVMPPQHDLRGGSDLVAIVGMSGRFPGSDNIYDFWQTLQNGSDLHEKIPPSRFDLNEHFDPSGETKNAVTTQYGCFLDKPGLFDSRLFNVSPRETAQMDPLHRLLLMSSYEALEMAGYTPNGSVSTDGKRVATYMGQATDDWRTINECQGVDIYYVPGAARAFTPGRLNYHFKWEGASQSIDAACAGGSTAVDLACSALLSRECDTALAGGGSILTAPAAFAGLSRGGFLSPTGGCKTFRDDADGYCRGEGVAVVVLKRLEDAMTENDNVLAVINGSARTYSAKAASITQPHADSQAKIYRQVLHQASVDPLDIGYVELHGTGTQWGDFTEINSISQVFGEGRTKEHPLVVGAVKANVGHGEAAAGVTSLIKCVMMLQRGGRIPTQPGMPFKLNHRFPPLEKINIKVADGEVPFKSRPRGDGKKKIMLNNFDASGGNTCLILEDPPLTKPKGEDPRLHHVVVCSARTPFSLKENKKRLLHYLNTHSDIKLCNLAYTTTARRMHDILRASFVAESTRDLAGLITSDLDKPPEVKPQVASNSSTVVFAFTGQGSLYSGMGRHLFETCSRFRESIFSYQHICDSQGLPQVVDLIASGDADITSKNTAQTQLAVVFLELALADLWKSWGISPGLLIGHSLGEYTALCVSGVLSTSDTLYLVGRRSTLIESKCTPGSHAMLAVGASTKFVEESLATADPVSYEISCMNAPSMTVLSGTVEQLQKIQSIMQPTRIKTTFLKVSYGFHSAQIDPILEGLEASASGIHFAKPVIPIASTLTGTIVTDVGTFTPHYLRRQAREPVNFVDALQASQTSGYVNDHTLWLEVGPDPVCIGLVRQTLEIPSVRLLPTIKSNEDNWKSISKCASTLYTSKAPIAWTEYHREYIGALSLLELPPYAFDLKDYWSPFRLDALVPDANRNAALPPPVMVPEKIHLTTTCLQYVDEEIIDPDKISITFSAHTSEQKLFDAIQGHLVDNTAICPASIFCDIAFTAAKYTYERAKLGDGVPGMSVWDMEITHPLVVSCKNPEQMIQATAVMKISKDRPCVHISFRSKEGTSFHDHGSCQIRYGQESDWRTSFSRTLPLVKRRIDDLTRSAFAGSSHRLQRPIIYKLFAGLVEYSDKYQGLEEVFMDKDYTDATARVVLQPSAGSGEFTQSPYWTDAVVHIAGFLLNGNTNNPSDIAYVSAGFESFRLFEELCEGKVYTSYVSIQPGEKKDVLVGDVYVFEGAKIIALCAGLFFHKINKKVLKIMFGQSPVTQKAVQSRTASSRGVPQNHVSKAKVDESRRPETDSINASDLVASTKHAPSQSSAEDNDEPDTADIILGIVASESGFKLEEMESSTLFVDMGVDSLMGIAIIAAVKKKTGADLAASFFNDYPTVTDLKREFGKIASSKPARKRPQPVQADNAPEISEDSPASPTAESSGSTSEESSNGRTTTALTSSLGSSVDLTKTHPALPADQRGDSKAPSTKPIAISDPPNPTPAAERQHSSHVVLIRGRSSSKETPLFLVTDGAGSATAYIHLPAFSTGNRIYALESPFLHDPLAYDCTVEQACALYVAAVRKTQPEGPYIIGGWSAGAAYAYEVVRQLLHQGETVLGLILIDMRVPRPMRDALEPSLELIEQAGLTTGIDRSGQSQAPASAKLKQHLVSTVKALVNYQPVALDPARRPNHSFVVWAQKGLSEAEGGDPFGLEDKPDRAAVNDEGNIMEDPKTGMKSWFYAKRTAFGPNGWDQLIGTGVECHVMEGADHFSMVVPPKAKILGQILEKAMKKCIASRT